MEKKVRELFTIDLRALAFFRIAMGAVTFIDLLLRLADFEAFYTDAGVLPARVLRELSGRFHLSLHLLNGSSYFESFLFIIAGFFSLCMLVGYRTRLMSVCSWIMLLSLQERNFAILNGGDSLHLALMFWCIFLPLGARYSVDEALNISRDAHLQNRFLSSGTVGVLLQVAIVYIFVALHKTGAEWFPEGTAVYFALSLEQLTTNLGRFVVTLDPAILKVLTLGTLFYQWLGPFLLFSPVKTQNFRFFALLGFVGMQIGFGTCMHLGIFPWISSIAMIPFIPTFVWEYLTTVIKKKQTHVDVFFAKYDQRLRFGMRLLKIFLLLDQTNLKNMPRSISLSCTLYVTDSHNKNYSGWPGVIVMLRSSFLGRPLVPIVKVVKLALPNAFNPSNKTLPHYRPRHSLFFRYLRAPLAPSSWTNLWVGFLIVLNVAGNITTLTPVHVKMVGPVGYLRLIFRLNQSWTMFSPRPPKEDGWFVIQGRLVKGENVSLFGPDQKLSWDKPAPELDRYKNARWQKYMMNLELEKFQKYCRYLAEYLCRDWNRSKIDAGEKVNAVEISFMSQVNMLEHRRSLPREIKMGHYTCPTRPE